MKEALRIFFWVTLVIMAVGTVVLINDGEWDLYAGWDLLLSIGAVYYAEKFGKLKENE
jgi:hypothetical protein